MSYTSVAVSKNESEEIDVLAAYLSFKSRTHVTKRDVVARAVRLLAKEIGAPIEETRDQAS